MAGEAGNAGGAPAAGGNGAAPAAPARARIGDLSAIGSGGELGGDIGDAGGAEPQDGGDDQLGQPLEMGQDDAGDGIDAVEPPPEDDGSSDIDPDSAPLFGLPPAEFIAAMRQNQVPQQLLDALRIAVPNPDGRPMMASIDELRRGFMKGTDYSRKTAEVAQVRREAEGIVAQDQQRWQTWQRDPAAMYDELEARGLVSVDDIINERGPLYEIALHIASQRKAFLSMTPAEQSAFIREQQAIGRQRQIEQKERQLQEREHAAQHQAYRSQHQRALAQMVPIAFQKLQLQDSPYAQKHFTDCLLEITGSIQNFQGLTQQIVDDATAAAIERMRELARYGGPMTAAGPQRGASQQQQRRPAGAQGLPATPLNGTRPGVAATPGTQLQRGRIGDLSVLRRRG